MNRLIILPVLLLTLLVGNPAVSADYQKGLDAALKGNFATALKEWKPLAEQGHVDAQYNLGLMYDRGNGVPQDYKAAVKWYRLAAEQGHGSAQNNLGRMYEDGKGVPQDYKTAVKWYRLAAERGIAGPHYNLGRMYRLGKGVPQNYKTAVKWFKLAAELGIPSAQTQVEKLQKKIELQELQARAKQGDARAQSKLGLMYYNGHGVVQDYVRAHMWWSIAASQGNKDAIKERDIVAKKMTPADLSKAQDLTFECVKKNYKGC